MSDRMKPILLMVAAFILGFGQAYDARPDLEAWPRWVIAGAVGVGIWIQAFWTTNPSLQPTTAPQLLASVQKSELAPKVKLEVAEQLAAETVKPAAHPKEPKA